MRLIVCLLLAACFIIPASAQENLPNSKINALLENAPLHHGFRADSTHISNAVLYVYFNKDRSYGHGDISATVAESLLETLLPLTDEFNAKDIRFLLSDKQTGAWKTIDQFVIEPPRVVYVPVENKDPYPAIAGKASPVAERVFPGSGQPGVGGVLSGKTVWLSPGHGWFNENGAGFTTQRGTTIGLVEDFITAETVDYFLMHYLRNAGASVWSVRERDVNTKEVIVNNDQGAPGYTETGAWADGSIAGYGSTYRTSSADAAETATAIFTPVIDSSGLYWVSVRFISGTNRATDVKYTVTHAGGTTSYTLNQEVHGDTWIYLGQFYFFAGGNYKVTISNQSVEAGQAIVADAVRFGGGVGQEPDCTNGGAASGRPRFEESARQYARFQGYPSCLVDVTIRPNYVEWELSKGTPAEVNNAVFVSFHTNAAGGTGTETYRYNGAGASQPIISAGSTELRDSIHKQVVADLRAGWSATWADRGVKEANFGELRPLLNIPGTLLELAFHDNTSDNTALRTPDFRRMAARAVYKGIVKFFNFKSGTPIIFLPEEPGQVRAINTTASQIEVSWQAPATGGILGHPATGYRLYVSENGRGYADGIPVTGTTYTFTGVPDKTYFFKVSATNDGGESFTSSVVAARTPPAGPAPGSGKFLIVDGFDRLDASAIILKNESGVLGTVRRMLLERMNSYDYMVEHGNGLASCNHAFDGVQNEVVSAGLVNLNDYFAVDWFTGEESTAGRSLDNLEKQKISEYLDNGGRLLISGAEIGWDIGRAASVNADLAFYNNYLRAVFVNDDATTYDFTGTSTLFNGQTGTFGNGFNGYYDVDFPDRINATNGSTVVLNYLGGTGDGAGVGYNTSYNLLYFAFPIEAITNTTTRNNLICQSAAYLSAGITLPVTGFILSGVAQGGSNRLSWTTQSEINTAYFVMERSVDGVHYLPIGNNMPARGVSGGGYTYQFLDNDIEPSAYYRVRAVDRDGKETLSNIVLLRNSSAKAFYVVENPVSSQIRMRVNAAGQFTVQLTNATGQQIFVRSYQVTSGQEISIPAAHLAKGMYWLTAYAEGQSKQSYKIVVQ